jgi:hypothetical protein
MSVTSSRSSASDSWVKSRPRSRSDAEATRRMAATSAGGSSPSGGAGAPSDTLIPGGQRPGSPWTLAAGGAPPSVSAGWYTGSAGGSPAKGDGAPNSSANTRSNVPI